MSGGGPPHHPHNRHVPPTNSAWNHLAVPSYFPRQPQVAHMQAEHSLLHQATWHTPTTTDAMKIIPHTQMLNEMFKNEALFPRDCVDLSLTRNVKKPFLGNQNGEHASTPAAISLSVRDASKINSLPPGMLDIQAVELTKCASLNLKSALSPGSIRSSSMSPGLKSTSPGLLTSGTAIKCLSPGRKSLSPAPTSSSPGLIPVLSTVPVTLGISDLGKNPKRSNIRVDSILERLNPIPEKTFPYQDVKHEYPSATVSTPTLALEKSQTEKPHAVNQSVIVPTASNFDENSNSSGTTNAPTPKEEDSASMHSNEDSLDSTKSRRKRKPSKTVRVNKDEENKTDKDQPLSQTTNSDTQPSNQEEEPTDLTSHTDPATIATILEGSLTKLPEKQEPQLDKVDGESPTKTRRKTSSEAETIDNIAAMVQEGLKDKVKTPSEEGNNEDASKVDKEEEIKQILDDKTRDIHQGLEPEKKVNEDISSVETDLMSDHSEKLETDVEFDAPIAMEIDGTRGENEILLESESVNPVDEIDGKRDELLIDGASLPCSSLTKPVTVSVIKTKEHLEDALFSGNDTLETPLSEEVSVPVPPSAPALVTPAQKKASNSNFVEVENKLEEMFAGIVEDHVDTSSTTPLVSLKNDSNLGLIDDSILKMEDATVLTKEESVTNKNINSEEQTDVIMSEEFKREQDEKKPFIKKMQRARSHSKSDYDGDAPIKKKKKLTKTKSISASAKKLNRFQTEDSFKSLKRRSVTSVKPIIKSVNSSEIAKDIYSYDSGSNASSSKSRGPFVQIRGPKDSPMSVSVVNTPLTDEDGEKRHSKHKKFHDDSEYRRKVRTKGLHCSTLSNKYDAERKDASWICAFCKRGPHANELTGPSVINEVPPPGDLFGPYFITTQCPEFEKRLNDPYDRHFKSRKITKALDAAVASTSKGSKKAKKKLDVSVNLSDIYLGITDTGKNAYEVWVHEDCMVWSSGVYLVGPKIAGLEEAVWTCSNVPCTGCGLKGANVNCVKRGCLYSSHVSCARKTHWQLDEDNFKAYCPEHRR